MSETVVGRFRGIADMAAPAAGLVPVENDPKRPIREADVGLFTPHSPDEPLNCTALTPIQI